MALLLKVQAVCMHYFRDQDVLKKLLLRLEEGELLGLLGIWHRAKTSSRPRTV